VLQESFHQLYHKHVVDQLYISKTIEKLITRTTSAKELLIKGSIDNEDYLAIKIDCEQRINVLGSELHSAYAFTLKKQQKLELASLQLSQLLRLYELSDLNIQRKLIALLLNDKVIFDGSDFNRCLTPAAQIIYNLRNSKAALVNCDELKITSAQDRVMCLQIKKIEYEKGNDIDETTSSQVLYFLKSFASLFPAVVK